MVVIAVVRVSGGLAARQLCITASVVNVVINTPRQYCFEGVASSCRARLGIATQDLHQSLSRVRLNTIGEVFYTTAKVSERDFISEHHQQSSGEGSRVSRKINHYNGHPPIPGEVTMGKRGSGARGRMRLRIKKRARKQKRLEAKGG